jgi:hypothetical protein
MLPDNLLAWVGAHILVIYSIDNLGILLDLLDHPPHVYGTGYVGATMADKYPYTLHPFPCNL